MQMLFDLKNRYFRKLEYVSEVLLRLPSLIFFLFFAIFLMYLSDRTVPTQVYSGTALQQHVHAGDSIVIDFKLDRNRICEVNWSQVLYDSQGTRFSLYDVPGFKVNRKIGKDLDLRLGIDLPRGMKPGPAIYESERQYVCNFTQSFLAPLIVSNPDVHFNIEEQLP